MPKTYTNCPPEVEALAAKARKKCFPELDEYGVTVHYQFVRAARDERTGLPTGTALTHGNYPADAIIKINSLQARVEGLADATCRIDLDRWEDMDEREQEALLAHELRHLEFRLDEGGNVKTDDAGRPALKMRPHDAQLGIFFDIAEWYGLHSGECRAVDELNKKWRQLDLFGTEADEPAAAQAG